MMIVRLYLSKTLADVLFRLSGDLFSVEKPWYILDFFSLKKHKRYRENL